MDDPSLSTALLALGEGLEPGHRERLAAIAAPARWEAGATVFREGECDPHLYLVLEGLVAIQATLPGRGPATLMTVGPGGLVGWSSLFDPRPKTAVVRAIEPTRALALDADRLRQLCDEDPALGYAVTRTILRAVADRLRATRMQLQDMFAPPTSPPR